MRRFGRFFSIVLIATLLGSIGGATAAHAQEQVPEAIPIVNIEFILDSSGSMASTTDTGETRMDASKRVLREVINSIPAREGVINVGFRIYGHEGDNSDATKELSCKASELKVPVEGVEYGALLAAVDAAQPTGWTPIARSLSRAGKDFPEATDGSINAVVLLTDGVETCDGDPIKVSRDLNRKPTVQMITHVIGFGTTPEEQQTLSGIAENGHGLLLGAANGAELRSALFSVLEELQIVVGAGYVGGNAFGLLPQGEPGTLAVVARAPVESMTSMASTYSFVIRNNTGEDVVGVKAVVTVRDAGGVLIGSADAQISPFFVRAGGLALAKAYFSSGTVFPPDAVFGFEVQSTSISDARFSIFSDLDIIEASLFENRIVGSVQNTFTRSVQGPVMLSAMCFDLNGTLLGVQNGSTNAGDLAPEATQSFEIDLFSLTYLGGTCPAFLVTAQGIGPVRLPAAATPAVQSAASRTPTPTVDSNEASPAATPEEQSSLAGSPTASGLDCVRTAEDVLLGLADQGLPIGEFVVYDEVSDPNTRLGRPHQYLNKVNFHDTTRERQDDFSIDAGGAIEVFAIDADATAWIAYNEAAMATSGGVQYLYQRGVVVLRLSGQFLPSHAGSYETALQALTICSEN